jgi:hypothetical protein
VFTGCIVQNGFLSAVPYLAYFCVSQIASHTADFLRSHHIINTTNVRKLAMLIGRIEPVFARLIHMCLGMLGQGGFLLAAGYFGNCRQPMLAIALITVAQVRACSLVSRVHTHRA